MNTITINSFWLWLFTLFAVPALACDVQTYHAELVNVVDGDTIDVELNMGLGVKFAGRVRIANFDAAETWRPRNEAERAHGKAATELATRLLSKPFMLRVQGWGVYNRIVADVTLHDGRDFATVMIDNGMAKREHYNDAE